MQDLIKQEQFEIEVIDRMNSGRLLAPLVFVGGSMLRLCYGLNRYSVDLDFWYDGRTSPDRFFEKCKDFLGRYYSFRDTQNKFYMILFELKSKSYPGALKIEIRKERKDFRTEDAIAFSRYSNLQIMTKVATLEDIMRSKVEALLDRNEIRDCFDIEFLYKKGISLPGEQLVKEKLIRKVDAFTQKDYRVKLGSILPPTERKYYIANGFKILKNALT